ncbi:polysaccharide deacetylase family protein [Nocardiopsis xinjiangensis]|uniref:polysaccharide deacetylase family protein n=1 Tax=Nocardiopsis xinjiangensis TaxID=124285 RepID=UPI00034C41A7|nr:polysaccharide deacetylase family protein [Nocardiopsis xinjiangensis]
MAAYTAVDRADDGNSEIPRTLEQPLRTVSEFLPSPLTPAPQETQKVLHQIDTDKPVIFVTIDDGHHPSPEALEVVLEHRMPVSLFLNEEPVRYDALHFEEYIKLGNHVHSHTLSHVELPQYGFEEQRHEICGMVEVLEDAFGDDGAVGTLLRAPYGASEEATYEAAATCGIEAIPHWSGTAEGGTVTLAHGDSFRPGDIILTHFTETLPEDLRAIQEKAEEEGFTIARLEDYL